jgi:hypothetical protein
VCAQAAALRASAAGSAWSSAGRSSCTRACASALLRHTAAAAAASGSDTVIAVYTAHHTLSSTCQHGHELRVCHTAALFESGALSDNATVPRWHTAAAAAAG